LEGDILGLTIASAVVGCAAAVAYHVFASRMQLWLAVRVGSMLPVLSVASMFLRLSAVGVVILVVHLWTPLNVVVTALAFVSLFTVLSGVSLYRFAMGRGPLGTSTVQR
jgi:hypothetical protein